MATNTTKHAMLTNNFYEITTNISFTNNNGLNRTGKFSSYANENFDSKRQKNLNGLLDEVLEKESSDLVINGNNSEDPLVLNLFLQGHKIKAK
jgi:hypothetical protein